MSKFASLLHGPQLPPEYRGKVITDPLKVLPKGGFAKPLKLAHDFPQTLRPFDHRTPLAMTVKQANDVKEVNLSGMGLEVIPPGAFDPYPLLEVIHLSNNRLTTLSHLSGCFRVKRFYAARNLISSLSLDHGCELGAMCYLEELDLSGNDLSNLGKVLGELEGLSALRTLSLHGCPCANEADYRARTLARMPFLDILDCRVVGEGERRAASKAFGQEFASGAVLVAAKRDSIVYAATARNQEALLASTARSHQHPTTHSRVVEVRKDGVVDHGNASGLSGLGRVPLPLPPPSIVFGEGPATPTSTRRHIKGLSERAKMKWDAAERDRVAKEFALATSSSNTWFSTIDHGTMGWGGGGGGKGGASGGTFTLPPLTTSALINVTQPAFCDDIATKKTREGMLLRGVAPGLLGDTEERNSMLKSSDLQSAFLTALAPAKLKLTGSAPLLPNSAGGGGGGGGGVGGGGGGGGNGSLSPTSRAPLSHLSTMTSTLGATHPHLTRAITTAASASGIHEDAHNHRKLHNRLLEASGVRTTLRPPKHAGFTAVGLRGDGSVDGSPLGKTRVKVALGRDSEGGLVDADGGPLLPTIGEDGSLGEWDRYRLLSVFKTADTDGSGELSLDEIRACITACADFGFCVSLDEATPPEPSGDGRGMSSRGSSSSSSRANTPSGVASSTALLGTTSVAGRAALLGAALRLNALLRNIFEVVDVDGSGTISWREFSQALDSDSSGGGGMAASASAGAKLRGEGGGKNGGRGDDLKSIPRMQFRPLNAEECMARANRHFHVARETYRKLSDIQNAPLPSAALSMSDPVGAAAAATAHRTFVKEQCTLLQHHAMEASEKAIRLQTLGKALGGGYDPPEPPPPPPPQRTDVFPLRHIVPATVLSSVQALKGARRVNPPRLPVEGAEVTEDERVSMRVLHPTVNQREEEAEDALNGGTKATLREESANGLVRTLGVEAWERHRVAVKGRAPRVLLSTVTYL